jgi:hypothetical protein
MKSKLRKNRVLLQPFQSGQVWQMEDSSLEIGLIGKTLVHYKHYRGQMKRSPVSLLNKNALERYLRDNEAVLVQPQPALARS